MLPVEDLQAVNNEALPGNVFVTWTAPAGNMVEVKATSGKSVVSAQAPSGDGEVELSLEPGKQYTISAVVVDQRGTRSEARTTAIDTLGSPVIAVAEVTAGSSFGGYDPINTINGNGMTGGNPLTATHDNDGSA